VGLLGGNNIAADWTFNQHVKWNRCTRSRHYVNMPIARKHPAPQWLTMDAAVKHCN